MPSRSIWKGTPALLVLSALGATIVMWILAYLWHHVLLSAFYVRHLFPGNGFGEVNIPILFLGYLVLGAAMAWLGRVPAPSSRQWVAGLGIGFFVGVVSVLPMSLMIFAVAEISLIGFAVDQAWHLLIEQPVGGLVACWVWGFRLV